MKSPSAASRLPGEIMPERMKVVLHDGKEESADNDTLLMIIVRKVSRGLWTNFITRRQQQGRNHVYGTPWDIRR